MYLHTHAKESMEEPLQRCPASIYLGHLSGTAYYDFYEALPQLNRGTALHMHREPDNLYDCYAIAVTCGPHKLGYIPQSENHVIARLLDAGVPLQLLVHGLCKEPSCFGGGLEVELFVLPQGPSRPAQAGGVFSPKMQGENVVKEKDMYIAGEN
jgi:hypothetical protein